MKKCSNCGSQISDNCLFCTECGKQIPQDNVCHHCGASVDNSDVFCQTCGNKVVGQQLLSTVSPKQKHCPHCGAILSEGDLFCERCGAKIDSVLSASATEPPQNVCSHCGAILSEGDLFCERCGAKIDSVPSASATESPQNVCSHCGTILSEGDLFCQGCGNNTMQVSPKKYENAKLNIPDSNTEVTNTSSGNLILLFGGIIVLLLLGVAWWYWDSSNKKMIIRQQLEIEHMREDSIRMAIREREYQDSIASAAEAKKQFIRDSYKSILQLVMDADPSGQYWGVYYFLCDITGDNIPELWLQTQNNLCAYTIQDGRLTTLFKGDGGHPYHHSFHQGDNYILMDSAHMGSQVWTKYSYNNGTILEREIYNKDNESYEDMEAYMEAEYKEPSEKAIEIYEVTNFEPIDNIGK